MLYSLVNVPVFYCNIWCASLRNNNGRKYILVLCDSILVVCDESFYNNRFNHDYCGKSVSADAYCAFRLT